MSVEQITCGKLCLVYPDHVEMKVCMSFSDMMQGDNGNIKEVLGIASFTDYLVIYVIYRCVVVFCHYSETALYNICKRLFGLQVLLT